MRIKRFEAPDAKSAFALVKNELGEDAVILSQKTLDAGTARQRIEIMAAMDYDLETVTASLTEKKEPAPAKKPTIYSYNAVRQKTPKGSLAECLNQKKAENEISFEAHDLRMRFASMLRKQGASPPTHPPATSPSRTKAKTTQRPNPEDVERWRNQLIDQLQVAPPRINKSSKPTILALIGPTGVGKTTTSAKIAAWYKLRKKDLTKAITRHQNCDLIIIDTAGKSPYDTSHIPELSSWLSPFEHIEPQQGLSATTKKEDLKHIITTYAPLGPTGIILTKLDETRSYAAVCQQMVDARIPVSYLATGQRVPEDFFVASKDFLENLFKRGWSAIMESEKNFPRRCKTHEP